MPRDPNKLPKLILVFSAVLICFLAGYLVMFRFLNLNEKPIRCDAIVLFVGPSYQARLKEAHQLMKEGYTDTLIVPAYRRSYVMENGDVVRDLNPSDFQLDRTEYPKYYERTHIEILEARKIMEELGFTSAIMVSAPTHMRRIKIISSKVFYPGKFQIRYIGSRYLRPHNLLSAFNLSDLRFAVTEAVKIISFVVYQIV